MGGEFSTLSVYLLQGRTVYFSSSGNSNSLGTIIVLAGLGTVIVVALIIGFIKNGVSASGMGRIGGSGASVAPRKFNGFTLRRLAASYGLDRDQTKMLEFVFRNDGVTDPARVLADPALLDRHFRRAYRTISQGAPNDNEAQERLSRFFTLRNTIESVPNTGVPGKISTNMAAVLFTGRDSFPVKVISARGETVVVEPPRNALGTLIQLPQGGRVTLSFFTKASSGFSYDSRVGSLIENIKGTGLQLTLLGKAKPVAQRKFKRKQISINCSFSFVFTDEASRGRQPKLMVDRRRFTGAIQDISVGGCSMKTSAAIRVGSRLKLEIDAPVAPLIACLGQVLRINRSGAMGTVMHIKFLKVPRRAFNNINALVFGYDE